MDISIVVPLFNEEESLSELMAWIDKVLVGSNYEVVFVDDGSRDNSWNVIQSLKTEYGQKVRAIKFARNYGKSAGLQRDLKLQKEL